MSRAVFVLVILAAITILLWWMRRRAAPRTQASRTAVITPPAAVPALPSPHNGADERVLRAIPGELYAQALEDERAADPHAQPAPEHVSVLLAASREIAQVGSEPRYTPRQPAMLPQIMEAVNDEDASLRSLSRIIAQDPELTSDLLRAANSPLYRVSSTPVESIERAAALVGTQGIRTLITAALMKPLAAAGSGAAGRFGEVMWEHSLYSASAAEACAARTQDCDPYTAHLLGLLHGLGSVAVYRALMNQYAAHPGLVPDAAALSQSLGAQSAVTAQRIAANWGLSDRTQEALESQSSAAPVSMDSPLGRALRFGRTAGALVLLCVHGRISADGGHAQLAAAGYGSPQMQRIWERLIKAYVSAR
ncbi:MAG: HDOD domain-containing protein [Steroidobacteraceae bacterium]